MSKFNKKFQLNSEREETFVKRLNDRFCFKHFT